MEKRASIEAIDARHITDSLRAPTPFDFYVRNNYPSFLCNISLRACWDTSDYVKSDELLKIIDAYAREVGLGETLDYINDDSVDNQPNKFIHHMWQTESYSIKEFERKLPEISSPIVAYRGYRTGINTGIQMGMQDFGGRLRSLTLSQQFMNEFASKVLYPDSIHTRVDVLNGIEVLPLFEYSDDKIRTEFEVVVNMGRLHVFKGDTVLEGRQRMLAPNIRTGSECYSKGTDVNDDLIHSLAYEYKFSPEEATALYGKLPNVKEVIAKLAEHYKKFTPQEAEAYYYGTSGLVDYYFIVSKPGTTVEYKPDYETDATFSLTSGGGKPLLLNDGNALGIGNVITMMDTFIHQRTQPKQLFPRPVPRTVNPQKRPPTRRGGRLQGNRRPLNVGRKTKKRRTNRKYSR